MRAQLFACLFPSVTMLERHPLLRAILTSNGFGEDTDFKKLQALTPGCESRRETHFLLCVYNRAKPHSNTRWQRCLFLAKWLPSHTVPTEVLSRGLGATTAGAQQQMWTHWLWRERRSHHAGPATWSFFHFLKFLLLSVWRRLGKAPF